MPTSILNSQTPTLFAKIELARARRTERKVEVEMANLLLVVVIKHRLPATCLWILQTRLVVSSKFHYNYV